MRSGGFSKQAKNGIAVAISWLIAVISILTSRLRNGVSGVISWLIGVISILTMPTLPSGRNAISYLPAPLCHPCKCEFFQNWPCRVHKRVPESLSNTHISAGSLRAAYSEKVTNLGEVTVPNGTVIVCDLTPLDIFCIYLSVSVLHAASFAVYTYAPYASLSDPTCPYVPPRYPYIPLCNPIYPHIPLSTPKP